MTTEELNALKDRAYKTAVEHGFHKDAKPDAYYLGFVMSKMAKAIDADRKCLHANVKGFRVDATFGIDLNERFEKSIKGSVEDGIAGIVIRLLYYAGTKGYKLHVVKEEAEASSAAIIEMFAENGLSGTLFNLNGVLSDALDENITDAAVSMIISVISSCFKKMTGSNYDLWWFVKQKMAYNELLPKLNGKKY